MISGSAGLAREGKANPAALHFCRGVVGEGGLFHPIPVSLSLFLTSCPQGVLWAVSVAGLSYLENEFFRLEPSLSSSSLCSLAILVLHQSLPFLPGQPQLCQGPAFAGVPQGIPCSQGFSSRPSSDFTAMSSKYRTSKGWEFKGSPSVWGALHLLTVTGPGHLEHSWYRKAG